MTARQTTHAVMAEPDLPEDQRRWIDAIRAENDPRHSIVPAHVTLVFPALFDNAARFADHIEGIARRHAPIMFHLRTALAVKDPLGPFTHVYLVPEEGFSAIVRLHDAFYTGPLADFLRLDVPYIPHVTVAAFADPAGAKGLVDRLNGESLDITGRLDGVSVLRCTADKVETLSRCALG